MTDASTSLPSSAAGRVSSRIVSSSSLVAASCGEVVGITVMIAMSPASLVTGASTDATPDWFSSAVETSSIVPSGILSPSVSRTTSSGPLVPGP